MKTVGGTQKTVSYYRKVENNCNYRLNQITSASFWIFLEKELATPFEKERRSQQTFATVSKRISIADVTWNNC